MSTINKDVTAWSAADLSGTSAVGGTFTVTGEPDLMQFSDDEGNEKPADSPNPRTYDQTSHGTPDGVGSMGPPTQHHRLSVPFRVTAGTSTFNIYQIDNDLRGGTRAA